MIFNQKDPQIQDNYNYIYIVGKNFSFWFQQNLNGSSMMSGSKVRLTTGHYDMGIKMKDTQRQIILKRNQVLISYYYIFPYFMIWFV